MDSRNLFETPTTYRLIRLEYLAALVAVGVLVVRHWHEIRWVPFLVLFAYIDVVGYLPGAIAARRSRTGYIHRAYHVLYNTMHSLLSAAAVAAVWWLVSGPEWALLALPLHLFTDRAVVGNFLKPFGVRFEPEEHPAYYAVKPLLDRPPRPRWAAGEGPAPLDARLVPGVPDPAEAGRT